MVFDRLDLGSQSNLFGKAALPCVATPQRQIQAQAIEEPLNKRQIADAPFVARKTESPGMALAMFPLRDG
jgi:hypothetical protein